MGDGWRPCASRVAPAVRPAVPSQPRQEASGWAHDGASDARHRGGGPALRSRRRAARSRQRALPRSRGLGRVRPRGRVELRGHGPVRVAPPAGVAFRAVDGAGRVRVVPRAAVRLRRSARVHGRHRAQRPLGPGLRPPPPELPDRTAADARATPARGGELRADPAHAGPGSAGQRCRRGDQRLHRRMPAQRPAHLGRARPQRRRADLRLAGDARPLPRGGRHVGAPVARRRRTRAPEPRPAVLRRRAHARAHRRLCGDPGGRAAVDGVRGLRRDAVRLPRRPRARRPVRLARRADPDGGARRDARAGGPAREPCTGARRPGARARVLDARAEPLRRRGGVAGRAAGRGRSPPDGDGDPPPGRSRRP